MEQIRYATRFRYLDADDVDDSVVDFDGLDVHGADGQKIGDVDGFIVDVDARRVPYLVIDSGGWFTSRRLLLPIGHMTLAADRGSLQTTVTRDGLRGLPVFDEDRFHELDDQQLRAFERNTLAACSPNEPLHDDSGTAWNYDSKHYRHPEWWSGARYAPERLRSIDRTTFAAGRAANTSATAAAAAPSRDVRNRDLATAREERYEEGAGDLSPHHDGRAQPGDVLGIETGGERTEIGDTAEDENKRRQTADRTAADDRSGAEPERTRRR
jgi:hypothetical protein